MQITGPTIEDFKKIQHEKGYQIFCTETQERFKFINIIEDKDQPILLQTLGDTPTHFMRSPDELKHFVLEKKNKRNNEKPFNFYERIKADFPHLFKKPYAPLPIDVKEQLQDAYPDVEPGIIKKAVINITKYPIYSETIIKSVGKPRINLDGTASDDTVSHTHKISAIGRLAGSLESQRTHYIKKLGTEKFNELVNLTIKPVDTEDTDPNAPLDAYLILDKRDILKILNTHEIRTLKSLHKKVTMAKNQLSELEADKYICIPDSHKAYDEVAKITGHKQKKTSQE